MKMNKNRILTFLAFTSLWHSDHPWRQAPCWRLLRSAKSYYVLGIRIKTEMSNHPWQSASNGSALVASLLDLGCVLGHRSFWILVQYGCCGRPHPAATSLFFNAAIVVKKKKTTLKKWVTCQWIQTNIRNILLFIKKVQWREINAK